MRPEHLFRIFQICFVVAVLMFIWILTVLPAGNVGRATPYADWITTVFAIYSGWAGFWFAKRIAVSNRPNPALQTSGLSRWWLGRLVRLASAESVCLSGFVLRLLGGPLWLVATMFGTGLALLLTLRLGSATDAG